MEGLLRPPPSAAIWRSSAWPAPSPDGAHLHIAIAVSSGDVIGGHLGPGSLVRTTAELRISSWALG